MKFITHAGLTHGEHQCDSLGQEAASHERKRLCRNAIKPLGVVDQADQGSLFSDIGEQAQDCQPNEEAVWWLSGTQAESRRQRIALGTRDPAEVIEHRCAELMQPRECELQLGFITDDSRDPTS